MALLKGSEHRPVERVSVAVPGNGVDIISSTSDYFLRESWLIYRFRGPAELVGMPKPVNKGNNTTRTSIVVISPDLSLNAGLLQRRTDVILDEVGRLVGGHIHGGVSRVAVERLILDGDGIDSHAIFGKGLYILNKVLAERLAILGVQAVVRGNAVDHAIQLHPARRAPDRSQQSDTSGNAAELVDETRHGSTIRSYAKLGQRNIGGGRVIISIGAS
jgi:hypothetical protein